MVCWPAGVPGVIGAADVVVYEGCAAGRSAAPAAPTPTSASGSESVGAAYVAQAPAPAPPRPPPPPPWVVSGSAGPKLHPLGSQNGITFLVMGSCVETRTTAALLTSTWE